MGGIYFTKHGLSLSTSDNEIRKKTINSVKEFIRLAAEIGTNHSISIAQGKIERNYEESFKYLKDSIGECARFAEEQGRLLVIEPVNRFAPHVIRTIGEGVKLLNEVASRSVKLCPDTFHMNIEERSMAESIKQGKGYIGHFHLSDNNRQAPGKGHIDFFEIAEALKEIKYEGFASAEIITKPDQQFAAKLTMEVIKSLPY